MTSNNPIKFDIPNFSEPKGLRRLEQYFNYAKKLEKNITKQLENEPDELDKWRADIYERFKKTTENISFDGKKFEAPKHVAQIKTTNILDKIKKSYRLPHTKIKILMWFLLCIYDVITKSTTYKVNGKEHLAGCIKALIEYYDSETSNGLTIDFGGAAKNDTSLIKRADGTDQRHSPKQSRKSWFTRDSKKRPRDDSAAEEETISPSPTKKRKSNDGKAIEVGNGESQNFVNKLIEKVKPKRQQLLSKVPRHMELCGKAIELVEEFLDKYEFDKSIIFDRTILGYGSKKGSEVWEIWKEFSKIKDDDVRKEFPAFWNENKGYLVGMTPNSILWGAACTQILIKAKNVSDTLQKFFSKEKWEDSFQHCINYPSDSIYVPNTTKQLFEEYKKAVKNRKLANKFLLQKDLNEYCKILSEQCDELNALIPKGYSFIDWINQFKDVKL